MSNVRRYKQFVAVDRLITQLNKITYFTYKHRNTEEIVYVEYVQILRHYWVPVTERPRR